jgi:hypothetical protein
MYTTECHFMYLPIFEHNNINLDLYISWKQLEHNWQVTLWCTWLCFWMTLCNPSPCQDLKTRSYTTYCSILISWINAHIFTLISCIVQQPGQPISTVTRAQVGQPRNFSRIPCEHKRFFFFSKASRSVLGSLQTPIPWLLGLFPQQ